MCKTSSAQKEQHQKVCCKINLGLQILQKRNDGFHEIHTVFYPTDFYSDHITLRDCVEEISFVCKSEQDLGPSENNLCMRAFRLLQADFNIAGVQIELEKGIPSGAGLGGGSADAACILKMLIARFQLPVPPPQLMHYAAQLGSDVPFFLHNKPMYATGRGELLEPINLNLSDYSIQIIKPDFSVSTREAYSHVVPHVPEKDVLHIIQQPITQWRELLHNDFEDSLFIQYPELANIKQRIYDSGAIYASMSGSGTAVYGIFPKKH